MDTTNKATTAVAPSMVAYGRATPATAAGGINASSGAHAVCQPAPTTKVCKETALASPTKDTPKKKKKKKKKSKKTKNASEKVPLMGKVKQAKMAHKMTKGLTWRQRWKLFKCYRKLTKWCSCCCAT